MMDEERQIKTGIESEYIPGRKYTTHQIASKEGVKSKTVLRWNTIGVWCNDSGKKVTLPMVKGRPSYSYGSWVIDFKLKRQGLI